MNFILKSVFAKVVAITFSIAAFAGNDHLPAGARSAGMANASVTLSDIWSTNQNQAGLGYLTAPAVGIYYENRFAVKELSLKSGSFAYPTKSGVLALSVSQFGYDKYNENTVGLAYAKSFGKVLSIGLQLDYMQTHIAEDYGSKGTAVAEFGLIAQPIKNLAIGAHVYNPTRSKIADYDDEKVPTIMRLGLSYNFSQKVILAIETEKDLKNDAIFKAGLEYTIVENLYFRAGIASNPLKNTFGLGYAYKRFKIDFAFSTHRVLGMTPHLSLIYSFK